MKYVSNFEDEVVCDFLVTSEMKRVRNVQLEMLDMVDKLCKKHGIVYYGDSGTLIGAIRHGGYIPWDDDIDIVMKREDYNKFIEIASKEFKEPFFVQTVYTDPGYFRTHAQIRNSNTTAILKTERDFKYKFNQGIFIDILPLDEIPDNKILFSIQKFRLKVLKFIMLFGYQGMKAEKGKLVKNIIVNTFIVPLLCKLIIKILGFKRVYRKFEKVCSMYNGKGNKRISFLSLRLGLESKLFDIKCFDGVKRVKFENQMMDIPIGYDKRLRKEYGDYMKMVKAPSAHGDTIFDSDKSYKEYIK